MVYKKKKRKETWSWSLWDLQYGRESGSRPLYSNKLKPFGTKKPITKLFVIVQSGLHANQETSWQKQRSVVPLSL